MSTESTGIEWTDKTWNPIRGCSRISPGCGSATGGGCYAEKVAARFSGPGLPYEGLARIGKNGARWTGDVRLIPDQLDQPLRWRKPRRIFVNSMSDLFHEKLTDEQIAAVFGVMAAAPQHTFQILTKRAERMRAWFAWLRVQSGEAGAGGAWCINHVDEQGDVLPADRIYLGVPWPLPNVWLGVSVEDQQRADERIPHLLATPAAVRFLSVEPLLGPVNLHLGGGGYVVGNRSVQRIDWVIVGGESGPGARPCDLAWVRSIVGQCQAASVAAFVKQLGARPVDDPALWREWRGVGSSLVQGADTLRHSVILDDRKGGDPLKWPEDLRVREFPRTP